MTALTPLTVALPLLGAAAIVAFGHWTAPRALNAFSAAIAAAVTVLCVILIFRSADHDLVYWFGGWRPRHGIAIGVAFSVDPFGASLAALAGTLMVAALVFSSRYFDEVGHLYYTLMLVFLAGLVGFALTGDLFNLFVFFELMGVAAYALTGYRIEQASAVQGALNFAITNTVGALFVLFGIALLYGRTGALNLAGIGASLAGHRADGLVIGALVLLTVGFLTKAGAVPFHFWLSDAYAVAPIPVGVLLTGVMSDLGYHAIGRIYWDVFSGPTAANADAVRGLLVGIGVATALVGGVMCLLEADLKRTLAFFTVSHGGIFLVAVGLLRGDGLGGASIYVVADGLLKGALFLAVGTVQYHLGSADELWLRGRGRGREHAWLGAVFVLCGLGLAGLPPFGPFLARALVEESARRAGLGWVSPVLTLATILSAAAVLRAAGRVFLGLGRSTEPLLQRQPEQPPGDVPRRRPPREAILVVPATVLAAAGLGLAFVPTLSGHALQIGSRAIDRAQLVAGTLHGRLPAPLTEPGSWHSFATADWVWGALSAAGAISLALLLLRRTVVPGAARRLAFRALRRPVAFLHSVHSGVVGDYVAWLAGGAALLAVVWGATLR